MGMLHITRCSVYFFEPLSQVNEVYTKKLYDMKFHCTNTVKQGLRCATVAKLTRFLALISACTQLHATIENVYLLVYSSF